MILYFIFASILSYIVQNVQIVLISAEQYVRCSTFPRSRVEYRVEYRIQCRERVTNKITNMTFISFLSS